MAMPFARRDSFVCAILIRLHEIVIQTYSVDLFLIRPPSGARHKAIPPSKIVFAGDSAGGNLCLTTLTVLRDMGIPMPAGAILISRE